MIYGNVDFEMLDHINQNRSDNKISNLRISTHHQNQFNKLKSTKGYYHNKETGKYITQIGINSQVIYGGSFNTEKEAYQKYLELKEIHHLK
jgi:hypothetical protein